MATAIGFLAIGSYARVETASGIVTLDTGIASIIAPRAGIIRALAVNEGQQVHAGDVLAQIRSEEDMIGGSTAPGRIRAALEEQNARLDAQSQLLLEAARADRSRLEDHVTGASDEISSMNTQISEQIKLVESANSELAQIKRIAASGFISRREIETREDTLISRRQQLAQFEQARTAKRTELSEALRSIRQSDASARAQVANTDSSRAGLRQQIAQADLAKGYVVTAPVDGVVTAVTGRIGQPTTSDQPLMLIVPAHAKPKAELYISTTAVGFISPGQQVRLAIDAFPYQSFGTVAGRISTISAAAISKQGPHGATPVYLVTADLARPSIKAFGVTQPLIPGMTLTARIVTEKRGILEWLFEPIFAVRNR